MNTLRSFLERELAKAIHSTPNSARNIATLLGGQGFPTWQAAFTHRSITGLNGQNYEGLETIGDAVLASVLYSYILKLRPLSEMSPSYFTELRRYWLSKPVLARFADELQLAPHIQLDPSVLTGPDQNIKEDVFEAFFGALKTTADTLIADGAGYIYCYNYFFELVKEKEILLPEDVLFPRKTYLKEIYDGLLWGDVHYRVLTDPDPAVIKVEVLDSQGNRLALGRGQDRSAAEEAAARAGVTALAAQGITKASIAASRPVDEKVENLKARVTALLARRGRYGPLEFVRLFRSDEKTLFELQSIQDYGTPKALRVALAKGVGTGARAARIAALYQFLNEH